MNIIVAVKVVPDDQDVKVTESGGLDFSKAHQTISTYDLNAIEAAARIASSCEGSHTVALSVGGTKIADSKVKKNILARGIDELVMASHDELEGLDARGTSAALAEMIAAQASWDVVVCGDGSADLYARQTGAQLAARLGVPYVSGVVTLTHTSEQTVQVERLLESSRQVVEVSLPCVIAVAPEFAEPRIAGMKDILAAGKKPMHEASIASPERAIEEQAILAPSEVDRKRQVFEDIDEFISAVSAAL